MIYRTIFMTFLMALSLSATEVSTAAVITVSNDSEADYTSIQEAINNANKLDTIIVNSGIYYENVIVNKTLVLRGNDEGGGIPVVDGSGNGDVINITSNGVVIEKFYLMNGTAWQKAGIRIHSNNNIVQNNNVSNNYFGIYIDSSENNTLINNDINTNHVNGINLVFSGNNTLVNNAVNLNKGAGIELSFSGNNELSDNNINSNIHEGIRLHSSSYNNLDSNIVNSSNDDGIILISSSYNILNNNNAKYTEKGINLESSNNNTLNNNIVNFNRWGLTLGFSGNNNLSFNTAKSNEYQGIHLSESSSNTLYNNNVFDNEIGILLMAYSSNNTLTGNNASSNGWGIELRAMNNLVKGNIIKNNLHGEFKFDPSQNNTIKGNIMEIKDFYLNITPNIIYKNESFLIEKEYENLTDYYGIFMLSDQFIIDENGNKTQIKKNSLFTWKEYIYLYDYPTIFNQNGTYTYMLILHNYDDPNFIKNVSFYYTNIQRPEVCSFDASKPVISMSISEGFSGFSSQMVIYEDGLVKSIRGDRLHFDPNIEVKSDYISDEELREVLNFIRGKGFPQMDERYEWKGVYDAPYGMITVNSEDICNSVMEYPFGSNPDVPPGLHDIERRIYDIKENTTKYVSEDALRIDLYSYTSVFKKGDQIDYTIRLVNTGNETINITNPDIEAGSIISEIHYEDHTRFFNKSSRVLTLNAGIIMLEPDDKLEIPLYIGDWQAESHNRIGEDLRNITGNFTIKTIYTSYNMGRNVWFGQIESNEVHFQVTNESSYSQLKYQDRRIPATQGVFVVIFIFVVYALLKRQ